MTVCVATLCEDAQIALGASDRMLTSGAIEFELDQPKQILLAPGIVAMFATESAAFATELLVKTRAKLTARGAPITVERAAKTYIRLFKAASRGMSETAVLAPFGLTHETFISRNRELAQDLLQQLVEGLARFEPPSTDCLFFGADPSGAHIYATDGPDMTCEDGIGFAAIGTGMPHAASYLMLHGHVKTAKPSDAILATYFAKRRAEVAPGVGKGTDLISAGMGAQGPLTVDLTDLTEKLQVIYEEERRAVAEVEASGRKHIAEHIEDLMENARALDAEAERKVLEQEEESRPLLG